MLIKKDYCQFVIGLYLANASVIKGRLRFRNWSEYFNLQKFRRYVKGFTVYAFAFSEV